MTYDPLRENALGGPWRRKQVHVPRHQRQRPEPPGRWIPRADWRRYFEWPPPADLGEVIHQARRYGHELVDADGAVDAEGVFYYLRNMGIKRPRHQTEPMPEVR